MTLAEFYANGSCSHFFMGIIVESTNLTSGDSTRLSKCVINWVGVPEFHLAPTTKGKTYNSLFHGEKLEFQLIALYVNWQSVHKGNSDRGFCSSAKGLCEHCTKG